MKTNQPIWQFIANLGDASPMAHSKNSFVKIKWDNDDDELRAGALSCNLVCVENIATEANA